MAMSCGETYFRDCVGKTFGRTVTIGRTAILTQNHNGRAACHYCGPCERGCSTFSYFSSPFTTVKDALKTGKCTLITNAVVASVNLDRSANKANGVTFVDGVTRQTKNVRAKRVILCAQALESTRILLNSTTAENSMGLGNSSGLLGRGLMDHSTGAGAAGELSGFTEKPNPYSGPHRANGIYVIRFRNVAKGPQQKNFIRGYRVSREAPFPSSISRHRAMAPRSRRLSSEASTESVSAASGNPWRATKISALSILILRTPGAFQPCTSP